MRRWFLTLLLSLLLPSSAWAATSIALPASGWVAALAAVFEADPGVACVTGLVLPAEVATRAQSFFEV